MEIAPYINASFTPSAAPAGVDPADHLASGLYAYINADKDPELKKRADATFGRTAPFTNSEQDATLIGRSFASRTGYRSEPLRYLRDNKLPIPPNWSGENAQLYTIIGQHFISKSQELYNNNKAARDKALAEAQKDIQDSFNQLPQAIADSILAADGVAAHAALDHELLQKLTKYNQSQTALTAQKRAALAWQYLAPAFQSVDHLQDTERPLLLDIANSLSDESGKLDPAALAAFALLADQKATELQSTDSQFFANLADAFQNFWRTTDDQIKKNGGLAYSNWRDAQGIMPERPAYYGDERVEKLYGLLNQAISTAMSPSEKAEWHAKLLSEMGTLIGESAIPMAAGIAASAITGGLGSGVFLSAAAAYAAGVAVSAPSSINNAIGQAYLQGHINPELYGTLQGVGQAAAENIGGVDTSLPLLGKAAGKLTNWAASRAAGSRFLTNQYARTTLNYLTSGALESFTEIAEEEIGNYIGSTLNTIARDMGAEVSPQAYKLGEALNGMKSHEVAAIFGYSYALGLFGIPANYRAARTFAQNTDNLLKAGHTPATARDIQLRAFQTEDKIAAIQNNSALSPEQKIEAIRKEEQSFATYQQTRFNDDVLSDPALRSRLEKEGRAIRDEAEVALDIEHEADLQILKDLGILEAVVTPGEKYRLSFHEQGETQPDGSQAPGRITTQEWSRMQLTNWLMLQKDTRIEQDLRSFQSLLLAHAHAQSATLEETKASFQNLGANRPLAALGELHKHGITPAFFQKAAQQAIQLQLQHQNAGMTAQEAAQQPSPAFEGLSLGEVQNLAAAAAERKEQETATTGSLQNITADTNNVEYGGLNLLSRDGTALIKYVAGRANILDILEERFEADIKQRTRGNTNLSNQLAETLLHIQSHLPGNIKLLDPKKKSNYTKADFIEAYSKIALGAFLYNEKNLPINPAGHRLIQNIARAVDTTRMFRTIGNAWLTYANSPKGKEHLANGGQTIADIMQQAGFTFSNQLASARATAQQRAEVLEARNWQPAIEDELDALLEQAEEEETLSDINSKEAQEPITIPADQSITGKEITIEPEPRSFGEASLGVERPETGSDEAGTIPEPDPAAPQSKHGTSVPTTTLPTQEELENRTKEAIRLFLASGKDAKKKQKRTFNSLTRLSEATKRITSGKGSTKDYAVFFRSNGSLTEAQAIEQGVRVLNQKGEPLAAYTLGRLIADRFTNAEYEAFIYDVLTKNELDALLAARTDEGIIKQANELTPKQLPKSPKWPTLPKKGVTEQQQREAIIKSLLSSISTDKTRYILNHILHTISGGVETFVATDGRRLSVITRPAPQGSKDVNETLDKEGNPVDVGNYPNWQKVMIPALGNSGTLDLAPYRFAEGIIEKTRKVKVPYSTALGTTDKYTTETYIPAEKWKVEGDSRYFLWQNQNKLLKFSPTLIRDAIKLFSSMGKAHGIPSSVSVDIGADGQMLWHSEHNGWTVDHLLMPLRIQSRLGSEGIAIANKGDILLNPQQDSPANFSIKAVQEMQNVHNCIDGLTSENKVGTLHNPTYGDFTLAMGRKGKKGYGAIHMHERRNNEGFTDDEAGFILVTALKAAEQDNYTSKIGNKMLFEKYGVRTVVAENPDGTKPIVTGFVLVNAGDENHAALPHMKIYALDELGSVQLVGASAQKALALFERIVNDNPSNWEQIITTIIHGLRDKQTAIKNGQPYEGSPLDIFSEHGTLVPTTDPTANFSIRAATPSTLDRFTADPLGERIVHTVRTEARRYARVLGDKTPQEQAMNAIASAESIINAVDKYLHRPDKPVSRRHRNQLTKLRSIIEKYAQIIASGTPRSFKRISPAEQQELQAAIAELEAAELDTAETDPALLIEDSDRTTKRTRDARAAELRRRIVREAAKGRVYKALAAMLDTAADALDDYLKDQLLTKLHRLTATVAIKRTTGKRLKGKMTAPMYRELEQAIQLMAYSTRQKEDAIDTILTAHETLAQAIANNEDNLTRGNTLLIELAHQLEQDGTPVTAQTLTAALAAHEARVAIFADITSKNYEQTRTAANAIYHIIRYGRALWQQKHDAREAEIQTYLSHFLANTTAEQGKANAIRNMLDKFKWTDALSLNATMNAAQTLLALSSYEPLRPIMQQVLENYSTASVARQKHLQEMRKQELYLYARILGIKPATEAGYSDKQLRDISDKFDTFYTENNQTVQTDITVTWQERNADGILETHTSAPLQLTKWEALNLILTYRQQDYQTNAQLHGYTDTVLDQLEKLIGTDLMDFGNGIQQALINDGTIPVYEEREGIPMRNNPLYWPGNININTLNTTREEPLVNPYHPAAGHDFLHTRVRHRNEIAHLNAFTVWRKAVADRANYIYSDPVTTNLESLLARQQFAGRLKTLIGEGLYRQLKATIAEIKNASWQETSLQDVNNTIVATAFASKSLAVLSGNPSSLIRQLSAVANAGLMPGLTPDKYLQYAIGLKQDQGHISIRDILQLDSFTTRQRDNAYVNEMLAMGNDVKFSRLMDWAKAGMNAMDKLDLLANAFSAAIVYNHKYDELKALGTLTEEQIKKQCENAVAVYTKLLAQPLNRTDKSALYWQLGNHALGRAVLFMSSESINKIGMLRANYIRMRNQGKTPAAALGILLGTMGITVGLTAAITEAALAILTGSLPDDDDNIAAWATALWLNASYGQYLSSLPLIGGVTDTYFSPYGGYLSGDLRLPGQDAIRYGGKLIQMLTDNKTYTAAQWEKETTRFMRDFTAVLGFAGGPYSRWQWYSNAAAFSHSLTAALNALYPIARGAESYSNTKRQPRRRAKSKIEKWLTPDK